MLFNQPIHVGHEGRETIPEVLRTPIECCDTDRCVTPLHSILFDDWTDVKRKMQEAWLESELRPTLCGFVKRI
jgi:hypothetical protein